jgi:hypothetical protein
MLAFLQGCLIKDLFETIAKMVDWSMLIHLDCVTYEEICDLNVRGFNNGFCIATMILLKWRHKFDHKMLAKYKRMWVSKIQLKYLGMALTEELIMPFTDHGKQDFNLIELYISSHWETNPESCVRIASRSDIMYNVISRAMTPAIFEIVFNIIANDANHRIWRLTALIRGQIHHVQKRHIAYLHEKGYLTPDMLIVVPWYLKCGYV